MKLCRFNDHRLGVVEGDEVIDVSAALYTLPPISYPVPPGDLLIAHLPEVRSAAQQLQGSAPRLALKDVSLLTPVANPSKIIGAPINYNDHIDESRKDDGIAHGRKITTIHDWGLFLKSSTSLIGFGEPIVLRHGERRNDHECELAVVIGKHCNQVSADQALQYVAGYAIGLDITLRGPEFQCWRKSIDTYSVLGPWLVTADELDSPDNLELSLHVNGEPRQSSSTKHLVMGVAELIAWASSMYALLPGDIIMTGTPAGVGPIVPGDQIQAYVQGVGSATIQVADRYA
ncbi:fumarylacetoacetate hydrolase family protein [Pusillimonas sp. CC-YST705]|uniref:Fumarylacetoacetate hydrolase family protein n=1 Tax=Mesopusillimonas faecipullorum TaxID=2755040 RepID=A0ABS8CFR3_9BURK|nr:fumarylacetoacetate hydrolase family protein [Mesopusillimonas faecipullorum]MCB5364871.1 fumarylacetoacetate hydrolase family protein [Mesopusillimonas faecipullorum]